MTWLTALKPLLSGLMAACLVVSAVDALFDESADGLRLACGLAVALCLARLAEQLVTM